MHQSELAGSVGVQEKIKMTLLRRLQSFLNHLLNPISNFIWATFPILLPSNNSRYPNYSVATLGTHSVTSSHVPWVNLLCAYRPPTVSKGGSDLVQTWLNDWRVVWNLSTGLSIVIRLHLCLQECLLISQMGKWLRLFSDWTTRVLVKLCFVFAQPIAM